MTGRSPYLLLGAVVLLLLGGLGGYLLSGLAGSDEGAPAGTSPAATSPEAQEPAAVTTETTGGPAPDGNGSESLWREIVVPYQAGAWEVRVSDELIVLIGDDEAVAYLPESDSFVTLAEATPVFGASAEGSLVVLWEGLGEESSQFVTFRVPDGQRTVLSDPGPFAAWPLLARGLLTWAEPTYDEDPAFQRLAIYAQPLSADGLPEDAPSILVDEVVELVEGDTQWDYASLPPYVAFEQHRGEGGWEPGLHLLGDDGQDTLVDPEGYSAWLTEDRLYWHSLGPDGVTGSVNVLEIASGRQSQVAASGEWPAAGPDYVAYLRPTGSDGGSEAYEVVVRELDGGEIVLATTSGSPVAQTLYASARYLAWTADGAVRVFARAGAPGRGLDESGRPGPGEGVPSPPAAPSGPAVLVPDVTGLYPDEAEQALDEAGLRAQVDMVYGPVDEDAGEIGEVYRQSPEPGARVPQGTVIRLRAWFETG
jgi:hypothetical protein